MDNNNNHNKTNYKTIHNPRSNKINLKNNLMIPTRYILYHKIFILNKFPVPYQILITKVQMSDSIFILIFSILFYFYLFYLNSLKKFFDITIIKRFLIR